MVKASVAGGRRSAVMDPVGVHSDAKTREVMPRFGATAHDI